MNNCSDEQILREINNTLFKYFKNDDIVILNNEVFKFNHTIHVNEFIHDHTLTMNKLIDLQYELKSIVPNDTRLEFMNDMLSFMLFCDCNHKVGDLIDIHMKDYILSPNILPDQVYMLATLSQYDTLAISYTIIKGLCTCDSVIKDILWDYEHGVNILNKSYDLDPLEFEALNKIINNHKKYIKIISNGNNDMIEVITDNMYSVDFNRSYICNDILYIDVMNMFQKRDTVVSIDINRILQCIATNRIIKSKLILLSMFKRKDTYGKCTINTNISTTTKNDILNVLSIILNTTISDDLFNEEVI